MGSIPDWGAYGRQTIDVSLSHPCFSLPLSVSLKSISISLGEGREREGGGKEEKEKGGREKKKETQRSGHAAL